MTEIAEKSPRGTWRRRILIALIVAILVVLVARTALDLWVGHRLSVEVSSLRESTAVSTSRR